MTYSEQTRPPWKAFVPAAKKMEAAEWTVAMDRTIAAAIGDSLWVPNPFWNYSNNIEILMRAAEKWCSPKGKIWQIGNWGGRRDICSAYIVGCGHAFEAPTVTLALAKALYAAIKAEEGVR